MNPYAGMLGSGARSAGRSSGSSGGQAKRPRSAPDPTTYLNPKDQFGKMQYYERVPYIEQNQDQNGMVTGPRQVPKYSFEEWRDQGLSEYKQSLLSHAKTPQERERIERQFSPDNLAMETVEKQRPDGIASFYDDSYGSLQRTFDAGWNQSDAMFQLLQDFKGDRGDWVEFLEESGPLRAGFLRNNPAYGYLQDFENRDKSMQAYGAGAGQIGQAAMAQTRQGQQSLAAAGLGRSTAMAGLANRMALGATTQQANLYASLWQQHVQRESMFAQQAFDIDRQVTQLALGQQMTPRTMGDDGGNGWWGVGGAVLGGIIGTIAAPGVGTTTGMAAGKKGGDLVEG